MNDIVISHNLVVPRYPARPCQYVDVVRVESQTATVVWRQCKP